jgi:hypothetical protein
VFVTRLRVPSGCDLTEYPTPISELLAGVGFSTALPQRDHREGFPPALVKEAVGIRHPAVTIWIVHVMVDRRLAHARDYRRGALRRSSVEVANASLCLTAQTIGVECTGTPSPHLSSGRTSWSVVGCVWRTEDQITMNDDPTRSPSAITRRAALAGDGNWTSSTTAPSRRLNKKIEGGSDHASPLEIVQWWPL